MARARYQIPMEFFSVRDQLLWLPVPPTAPAGGQGATAVAIDAVATGAGKLLKASKVIIDGLIYAEAVNYCKTGKY